MDSFSFGWDFRALLGISALLFVAYILEKQKKSFSTPHLLFSSIKNFGKGSLKLKAAKLPTYLFISTLILFSLAFIDIHFFKAKGFSTDKENKEQVTPTEGIALYFILDQSGSMSEVVRSRQHKEISKVDLLKEVTAKFIQGDPSINLFGRSNDMIGLIAFARSARVLSPLTLDHEAVLRALAHLAPVKTKDSDGTSIGYAIFKTANMIAATRKYANEMIKDNQPSYNIKNSVMILVTDGLQDPNPLDKGKRWRNMDFKEAAEYAKRQNIRLYIVNVEPSLSTENYAPYRHLMEKAAELTGGKFYEVDSSGNLEEIYREIDRLEKSVLPYPKENIDKINRPDLYTKFSFSNLFIVFGLLTFLVGLTLDMTLFRRVP